MSSWNRLRARKSPKYVSPRDCILDLRVSVCRMADADWKKRIGIAINFSSSDDDDKNDSR